MQENDITQSFSNSGSPHNNVMAEALFSYNEKRRIISYPYHSDREFNERINHYIDFDNNKRTHSTLDQKTPNRYEELLKKTARKTELDKNVQKLIF